MEYHTLHSNVGPYYPSECFHSYGRKTGRRFSDHQEVQVRQHGSFDHFWSGIEEIAYRLFEQSKPFQQVGEPTFGFTEAELIDGNTQLPLILTFT